MKMTSFMLNEDGNEIRMNDGARGCLTKDDFKLSRFRKH